MSWLKGLRQDEKANLSNFGILNATGSIAQLAAHLTFADPRVQSLSPA